MSDMSDIKKVELETMGLDDVQVKYEFEIMPTNVGNKFYHEHVMGFLTHLVRNYGVFSPVLAGMAIPNVFEWKDIQKISREILRNASIMKAGSTYVCDDQGNCELFIKSRNERYIAIYFAMLINFPGDLSFFGLRPPVGGDTDDKSDPETAEK